MRKRVILAARTDTDDPSAGARGHVEAQEAIDLTDRLAAKLDASGGLEVHVVPHVLHATDQILWINRRFGSRDAGLALEIHKGKGPRGTSGVEAWVATGDRLGRLITATVLRELSRAAGLPDRGVKEDAAVEEPGARFLARTRPVAALLACGYMGRDHFDNERYAEGLLRGLLIAFGHAAGESGRMAGFPDR
jgi:N-acetylmuramoyl-L-alanine amidase-like protein